MTTRWNLTGFEPQGLSLESECHLPCQYSMCPIRCVSIRKFLMWFLISTWPEFLPDSILYSVFWTSIRISRNLERNKSWFLEFGEFGQNWVVFSWFYYLQIDSGCKNGKMVRCFSLSFKIKDKLHWSWTLVSGQFNGIYCVFEKARLLLFFWRKW